jgi:Leucine-rich repeat (LRR) protein
MPSDTQKRVIKALSELYAYCTLDEKGDPISLNWGGTCRILDGGLMLIVELDTLKAVGLYDMTDDRLGYVAQLPRLKSFSIDPRFGGPVDFPSHVSDAGLAHLAGLTELERLHLGNCAFTDVGIAHLSGLTKLEYLSVSGTEITRSGLGRLASRNRIKRIDGLEDHPLDFVELFPALEAILNWGGARDSDLIYIKNLRHLKELIIVSPHITDACVEHLLGLNGLRILYLYDTQITERGSKQLQEALPTCEIVCEKSDWESEKDLSRSDQLRGLLEISTQKVD